jgi:Protein of unknown function (DUF3224)
MQNRANCSFTIDSKDDSAIDWAGGSMDHSRWAKTFTGELSGTSVVELILGTLDTGAMVYVGVERFDCELSGRKGSFVISHSATMLGSDYEMILTIVPGSGTDELKGISGRAEITPDHDLILDYDIES